MSEIFETHRRRLFGIAYGMLGQVMDAEDVVQDAYLRWQSVEQTRVENPGGYLTTITTRIAIDRLRSAQKRRETYIGPWLPEPVVADADPADVVAEAERISFAFLTALERLNPVERAVLLLRDVFDLEYADIADVVDRTPANCRQIAVRAREHVGDAGRSYKPPPEREQELVAAFVTALAEGELDRLMDVFAADVTLWSDGGGKARAARHPISGALKVARFLLGIRKNATPDDTWGYTTANGDPAIVVAREGKPFSVMVLQISDGGIIALRSVLNPDKLEHWSDVATPNPVTFVT